MARWRAEAIERLPELRQVIAAADNVMALWIELVDSFHEAYRNEPRNDSRIGRIYSYADWCLRAPRRPEADHDPFTAVVVCFYEDIPTDPVARDDMPRWFPCKEVEQNRKVFAYHLSDEEYEALVRHMSAHRNLYRPRDGAA